MDGGIYKIVNTIDGKQYVGSAVNLLKRQSLHWHHLKHGTHVNAHLQYAWNKYGEEALEFRVVGKCPPEKLIQLEQEVMDHLKPEYNLSPTAGSQLGMKHSDEARRKMSEACRGRVHSAETRRKISEAASGEKNGHWGKTHTQEARQRISEAAKGNTRWLGKKHSVEAKRKMSNAKRNPSVETIHKLREASLASWATKKAKIMEVVNE